jgi:SAM-dependent methyltransferase
VSRLSRLTDRLWASAESAYRRKILETLPLDPSAVLLDVGCEDGAWTEQLRQVVGVPHSHVQGLEIAAELVAAARARGFDVRIGDIDALWPFENASMDIVHANQVIEHVQRLDHFAQELKRVLAPNGLAIVCTENLASWHNLAALTFGYQPFSLTNISRLRPVGNRFAAHDEYVSAGESFQHVHVMTLKALRDLFAAHGFTIQQAWGRGYHPFPSRLAVPLATLDPWHAHFICVVLRSETEGGPRRNLQLAW